jgi:hypothetical protein
MTATTTVPMIAESILEASFVDHVIDIARRFGWLVHHDRPARTHAGGWRTPIQGHRGFPDLVLVPSALGPRVLYRECKTNAGRCDTWQSDWLTALIEAGQDATVWRPRDYPTIVTELTFGAWTVRGHEHGGLA